MPFSKLANIINMLKAALLAVLFVLSTAQTPSNPTKDFINGFFDGIGANGSIAGSCSSALTTLTNSVYAAATALETQAKAESLQNTINSLNSLQAVITAYESTSTCNFSGLEHQLGLIFSKGGWEVLIQNYLANGAVLYQDYETIMTCSSNYYKCGYSYGNAFEKLVGWSLSLA